MKRTLLVVALAAAFLAGYAGVAYAYPAAGVFGRAAHDGYFKNIHDTAGTNVLPPVFNNGGVLEAFPANTTNANAFISFVEGKLGGNAQERTGAAFLIESMISTPTATIYRSQVPPASDITVWEDTIRDADANNRITWRSPAFRYTINSYYQGVKGGGSGTDDDAFFADTDSATAMVFRDGSGAVQYAIRWECANPVGDTFDGLDKPWQGLGHTVVTDNSPDPGDTPTAITTRPGNTVHFAHYIQDIGPFGTGSDVIWSAILDQNNVGIRGGQPTGSYALNEQKLVDDTENIVVPSGAAAGTQYCRKVLWSWKNSWGGGDFGTKDGYGAVACATVAANYNLNPVVSVNQTTAQPGDTISFTYTITNTDIAGSPSVACTIQNELGVTVGPPTTCPQTFPGSAGGPVSVTTAPETITITNQPPGTKICRKLVVTPAAPGVPSRTSTLTCVTIAKSPFVSFLGGDVWAGGGFAATPPGTCTNPGKITSNPSRSLTDGSRVGSGVAYAAFALGKITNFGSGSMALVTATGTGDNWTFSNISPGNLGYFGASQHCINDYASTYSTAPVIGAGTIDLAGGVNGAWKIVGNPIIHGAMSPGAKKVYYVSGNVTIDNNITYPASYGSAADIPSLVIIATGSINVAPAVTQLDGQFIARGTFYTCFPKIEPAIIATCPAKLTLNGSVSSKTLDLFRTGGSDGATPATQKIPSETFNLSSEVYISNALNQTSQTVITTSNVRELPPRF